ncbi:MAG: hypothetical protein GY874_23295 [Desulfobacteraceae bacterium]|nr:hypothetical protein [Desulfobacteraceae bacterium]
MGDQDNQKIHPRTRLLKNNEGTFGSNIRSINNGSNNNGLKSSNSTEPKTSNRAKSETPEQRKKKHIDGVKNGDMLGDHELKPLAVMINTPIIVVKKNSSVSSEGKKFKIQQVYGSDNNENERPYWVVVNEDHTHFDTFNPEDKNDDKKAGEDIPGNTTTASGEGNNCLLNAIRGNSIDGKTRNPFPGGDNNTVRNKIVKELEGLEAAYFVSKQLPDLVAEKIIGTSKGVYIGQAENNQAHDPAGSFVLERNEHSVIVKGKWENGRPIGEYVVKDEDRLLKYKLRFEYNNKIDSPQISKNSITILEKGTRPGPVGGNAQQIQWNEWTENENSDDTKGHITDIQKAYGHV